MHKRIEIDIPPGIVIRGTDRQSAGRYVDGNLVRFYEGETRPVGGWRALTSSPIEGKGREIFPWLDNSGSVWAGVGTEQKLYVMTQSGVLHDVTPSGFTVGQADASNGGGYGDGIYGAGVYGLPIVGTDNIIPASVWSLDVWNDRLVGVMAGDGKIYEWTPSGSPTAALPVANAPENCTALLVTNEKILVTFGADGNPRRVKWCTQGDNTVWSPNATNQAGEYDITTQGRLCCGVRVVGGFLAFTDTDSHAFRYIDGRIVYGSQLAGEGSGVISQNAAVPIDGRVIWMGPEGFWEYNGFVQPMPCDIAGRVFTDLNRAQISKVSAFNNSPFGEIWWMYPSANSLECDSVAVYSYREGTWAVHSLERLSGADRDPFQKPLMVGSDGHVYEHETGYNHGDNQPFLKTGPLQFGDGDNVIDIWKYIPDERVLGQVDIRFCSRYSAMGDETVSPYFDSAAETPLKFINGRQHSLEYRPEQNTDWRIGRSSVDIKVRGRV